MVVKSLKPLLILFFKTILFFYIRADLLYRYYFSVFIPILYIGTVFLYSYWFPILVRFSCIVIDDSDIYCAYDLTCHHLRPDSCMLSHDTYLISFNTNHLIYYHLTCNYYISRILSCYYVLYTMICISCTYVLLLPLNSWTCPAPAIPVIW